MSLPTTTGCRKYALNVLTRTTDIYRIFFPSTEEAETDDWEEVEAGETSENGPVAKEDGTLATEEAKVALPDVPTAEPTEEGPAAKKQKSNDDDEKL